MTAPHIPAPTAVPTLTQRFSASRRGARLARQVSEQWLIAWGRPRGTETFDTVTLVVAELASNAALHGLVPGRDFALRLRRDDERGVIRIEVSDAHPAQPACVVPRTDDDHGRGMVLVDAIALRWGVSDRIGPGKTVWAECAHTPDRRV